MKKTVILDTNFLLIPGQFGVDVFGELRRVCDFPYDVKVLAGTMVELEKLVDDWETSAKDRRAAGLGLALIKAKGVEAVRQHRKVFKSTDKAILDFAAAGKGSVVVATQDRLLREKLKSAGVSVIIMRQQQYLALVKG